MSAVDQTGIDSEQYTCTVCRAVYRSGFPRCPKDGGVLEPLSKDPLEGSTFADRYIIENCVGEGAMGRVYRARHARMSGRIFAVKVMFGDLAADAKMRSRFEHEAEASSRLSHEHLVSVVDFGETDDGLLYLVMDFIEGRNIAELLEDQGAVNETRAVKMFAGMLEGIEHAHEQGLIHRDLKTENVVVVNDEGQEIIKIVDFGIAKLTEMATGEQQLTAQGCVVGTPAYMSPEQACGEELDIRTDLFSLGLIVYELLAGKKPFDGTPMEVARQNIGSNPPSISHRNSSAMVSPELEALIFQLLEKHKEDRPESATEVLSRLEEIYGADTIYGTQKARPRRKVSKKSKSATDAMLAALATEAGGDSDAGETVVAPPPSDPRRKRRILIGAAFVGVVCLVGLGLYLQGRGSTAASSDEVVAAADEVEASETEGADEAESEDPATILEDDSDVPPPPELKKPRKVSRRSARRARRAAARRRAEAAAPRVERRPEPKPAPKPEPKPKAEPKVEAPPPKPELPPVSTSDFSRKYIQVGSLVDRLAREQGQSLADRYSSRYLRINLNDSLRLDELRRRNMAELLKLERQIKSKLGK